MRTPIKQLAAWLGELPQDEHVTIDGDRIVTSGGHAYYLPLTPATLSKIAHSARVDADGEAL